MRTTTRSSFHSWTSWLVPLGFLILVLAVLPSQAGAQSPTDGEAIFNQKGCTACHTVGGGPLVGPDLQGVTDRRDIEWLRSFIAAPDQMLASGDPIAAGLLAEYNNIAMPNMGLSAAEVEDVIAFLATTSQGGGSAPVAEATPSSPSAPSVPSAPPNVMTALTVNGNAENGRALFTGQVRLEHRGTACVACHSTEGIGALGGGALGPDLTHVYTRFGRQGLAGMLGNLPFPTMQGIFATRQLTVYEQADLLAFFEQADKQGEPRTLQNLYTALGVGSGLAVGLLAVMLVFYPRQRMSIAQRLRKNGKL
mgnify:CR=1 FL=1